MLATLRGYKLWIYQNCDGKYLKRLTFVQRTFRLPCSSPSLTCFPGSILCFRFHSGAAAFSFRHVRTFFWKSFIRLSDDCFVSLWLWCLECTVFCGSCTETIGSTEIPEALKSCMWAPCADYLLQDDCDFKNLYFWLKYKFLKSQSPCADYLLQDDCDFKNLYFSQKSPQCDPSALLVRENGNSGQNFNWSSIMWKTTTFIMIICLVSWGA